MLEDKFVLDDLKEAWGCYNSQTQPSQEHEENKMTPAQNLLAWIIGAGLVFGGFVLYEFLHDRGHRRK